MNEMQFLRILSHGQITNLADGFALDGQPFSIYVRPKQTVTAMDMVVSAKCICDTELSSLPVSFNDWTPASIVALDKNAINLAQYDVYWGAGNLNI